MLISVEFEVHGTVQGVFFRKYTAQQAKSLNLKGWCKNTVHGTVLGVVEGEENDVKEMRNWLEHVGSPQSRIDYVDFRKEQQISVYSYSSFDIKH